MSQYAQYESVQAMRDAAKNPGAGGMFASAGIGLGMGARMGDQFAQNIDAASSSEKARVKCAKCGAAMKADAKFCPECGARNVGDDKTECPKCGAAVRKDAKFCPECGAKIALSCPKCGAAVKSSTKFCPECGNKLK
jgi:membrane protease subunit (stomatin/prohibitin family)